MAVFVRNPDLQFRLRPRQAFCDGQLLPISQNQALFSLLGTTYGGDGEVTFALPTCAVGFQSISDPKILSDSVPEKSRTH